MPMKVYHFISHQLVGPEISNKILEIFDESLTEQLMFPEKRCLQKSKKLGEIIKLFNMSPFTRKEKNGTSRVSAKKSDQENWWSTKEN